MAAVPPIANGLLWLPSPVAGGAETLAETDAEGAGRPGAGEALVADADVVGEPPAGEPL